MGKKIDIESDDEVSHLTEEGYSMEKGKGGTTLKPVKTNTPMEVLSGIVAAASVATSVGAMLVSPTNVVYAAGGISCFIGPYAFFQQKRLTDLIAMEETHAALTAEIDRLASEKNRLHDAIASLSKVVDGLEDAEHALDTITQMQGMSIEALEEQVKDNRDVLNKLESDLKSRVLQNLLQCVIKSDADGNGIIDPEEIEDMCDKIEGAGGVRIHRGRFADKINDSGGGFTAVMAIIADLMDHADDEDENVIFVFVEDDD